MTDALPSEAAANHPESPDSSPERERDQIASLARGLRLLDVMWDGFATGMLPSEVAHAAGEGPSYATRALATLAEAGWVERIEQTRRWRPSVRLVRKLQMVRVALEREQGRLDELGRRVETSL